MCEGPNAPRPPPLPPPPPGHDYDTTHRQGVTFEILELKGEQILRLNSVERDINLRAEDGDDITAWVEPLKQIQGERHY